MAAASLVLDVDTRRLALQTTSTSFGNLVEERERVLGRQLTRRLVCRAPMLRPLVFEQPRGRAPVRVGRARNRSDKLVLAQLIRHRQRDDGTSCALTLSVSALPTGRVAETPVSSPADNPRATLLTSTSHARYEISLGLRPLS